MYSDFNMPNYYGIDNFDYRQEYNYQNFNQQNMYNSELITFNQAIDLINCVNSRKIPGGPAADVVSKRIEEILRGV